MRRQAWMCYNVGVLPPLKTSVVCVQPLRGRYVTVEERNDVYTPCISLCDITIYEGGCHIYHRKIHMYTHTDKNLRVFELAEKSTKNSLATVSPVVYRRLVLNQFCCPSMYTQLQHPS